MAAKHRCRYCGAGFTTNGNKEQHEDVCPMNPTKL